MMTNGLIDIPAPGKIFERHQGCGHAIRRR